MLKQRLEEKSARRVRAQVAIEYLLIIGFVLGLITLIAYMLKMEVLK